jgi:hypothetical protein
VVGQVDPSRSTPLSVVRELMEDAHGVAAAMFEAQARIFGMA